MYCYISAKNFLVNVFFLLTLSTGTFISGVSKRE